MSDPAPRPFNKGRLILIWLGLAVFVIGTWLVIRSQRPEAVQFKLEPETEGPEQQLAFYLARADVARGQAIFARCAACHRIEPGAPHAVGPNLHGVMGQPIAARPGFNYSDALRNKGGSWDWETTNLFLRSPRHFAPGTRMAFGGITRPQERADLMLYLNREGGTLGTPEGAR